MRYIAKIIDIQRGNYEQIYYIYYDGGVYGRDTFCYITYKEIDLEIDDLILMSKPYSNGSSLYLSNRDLKISDSYTPYKLDPEIAYVNMDYSIYERKLKIKKLTKFL